MTTARLTALWMAAAAGMLSACEMTYDPETGQSTTQWTLPGTAANEASFNERWRRCIQYASESNCEQQFGGRTPMESDFVFGSGRDPDP